MDTGTTRKAVDFSSETMLVRRQWKDILKVLKVAGSWGWGGVGYGKESVWDV